MMMGKVVSGWFLFWQAGIAGEKLDALAKKGGVSGSDHAAWPALRRPARMRHSISQDSIRTVFHQECPARSGGCSQGGEDRGHVCRRDSEESFAS
jgi:hypothetical protein